MASGLRDLENKPNQLRRSSTRLRTDQRDRGLVPRKLGQLQIIAKPQRQHVAVTLDADRFPPAVFEALLCDDEVARTDLVPRLWQARCHSRQVFVFAAGCTWYTGERRDDLAVQSLPDVRHKPFAGRVQPSDRQLLGEVSQLA